MEFDSEEVDSIFEGDVALVAILESSDLKVESAWFV